MFHVDFFLFYLLLPHNPQEKIEEGKLLLEPVDFRCADMLGEAVRTFAMPIQVRALSM
jgi:hypothetical protein